MSKLGVDILHWEAAEEFPRVCIIDRAACVLQSSCHDHCTTQIIRHMYVCAQHGHVFLDIVQHWPLMCVYQVMIML